MIHRGCQKTAVFGAVIFMAGITAGLKRRMHKFPLKSDAVMTGVAGFTAGRFQKPLVIRSMRIVAGKTVAVAGWFVHPGMLKANRLRGVTVGT